MRAGQSTRKRRVYVNGMFCESMTAAAIKASNVMGRKVELWEIQRILQGKKRFIGIDISTLSPTQREKRKR